MTNTCWQYLIKKRMSQTNPVIVLTSPISIQTVELNWHQAQEFILKYEWLGNMGTSNRCFGLLLDKNLASVVCYGPPIAPSRYNRILGSTFSQNVIQLCRGATAYWAPKWAASKLISTSMDILRRNIDPLIVIAYADPKAGEVGVIYQACNAYYLGKTDPGGGKRYIINGHNYDPRKVQKKFGSRSHEVLSRIDPDYSTLPINPKHRYVLIRGSKLKRRAVHRLLEPHIIRNPPKRKLI